MIQQVIKEGATTRTRKLQGSRYTHGTQVLYFRLSAEVVLPVVEHRLVVAVDGAQLVNADLNRLSTRRSRDGM